MSRLDAVLTRIENVLAAGSLVAATGIAIAAVISRFAFGSTIFWSEEAIIYLIIFSTFLGAVITLRHNEHVNVDLIPVFLRDRGKRVMAVLATLIMLLYFGIIGYYAWVLIAQPSYSNTVTPAIKAPLWVVTLGLPIGLTLMFLRSVEMLVRLLRGRTPFPGAAPSPAAAAGSAELDLQAEMARAEAEAERAQRPEGTDPEERGR